jgi:type IV pilus assembly protein PilV
MLKRRARGGSLLEVLVAITISSMGLLALAASHMHALRQASLQQHRVLAAWLVSDLAERIRMNSPTSTSAEYAFTATFSDQASAPAAPSILCVAKADACTVAEMAAADLHAWRSRLRAQLPNGSGFVRIDTSIVGAIDIWAAWTEPGAPSGEDTFTEGSRECPSGLSAGDEVPPVRCQTLRIQL